MISDWTDHGGTTYIHYHGTHDELRKVVQEGDTVKLLKALPDGSEYRIICGIVDGVGRNSLDVMSVGIATQCTLKRPDGKPPYLYKLMDVLHPVENKMPDSSGMWRDRRDNVWLIDDTLRGYVFSRYGCWTARPISADLNWYADGSPFTKLTITEDEQERNYRMAGTPDSAGLWKDGGGRIWVVDEMLFAICICAEAGKWGPVHFARPARTLTDRAPFTKLTITEKEC